MAISTTTLQKTVVIPVGQTAIAGTLVSPVASRGTILFAHGAGSGRFSPLNRAVSRHLNDVGFTTLLLDLVTPTEEVPDDRSIPLGGGAKLLASRLGCATDWVLNDDSQDPVPIGYFGAFAGAAAVFIAAAQHSQQIKAIVCWDGCLDLAGDSLPKVTAPTLLLIGAEDELLATINHDGAARLGAPHKTLMTLPGQSQVFEDDDKLHQMGLLACDWFLQHMRTKAHKHM